MSAAQRRAGPRMSSSGAVNLVADVSNLWNSDQRDRNRQVVSGIAHIAGDEYLISGKDWPQSYRVLLG